MLLLHLNQPLSTDRLVSTLWGESASAGAAITLRTHVGAVRRALTSAGAGEALVTGGGGYALRLDPDDLDAEVFEHRVHRGQEALALEQPDEAARLLRAALALWRGPVLTDLGPPDFAGTTVNRLDELRAVAEESAIAAELALGLHREVVGTLQELVAAHPFRERLAGQLMLALYRSGRQADALATYAATKVNLAEELGLDPGPELRDLETAILRQDPALLPVVAASSAHDAASGPAPPPRSLRQPLDGVYAALERGPLVGRDTVVDTLDVAWGRVLDEVSTMVAVSGSAGTGKSRLVAHLAGRVRDEGGTVLVGRCDERVPYAPLTWALGGSPVVREVMSRAPQGVQDRLRPLLPWDDVPESAATTRGQDAAGGDRAALSRAVAWLLDAITLETPLLLVVEDGERLDDATAEVLAHLASGLPRRTLVVLCFRDPPGSRHPPLADLLGRSGVRELTTRLTLGPLDQQGLRDLVDATAPGLTRDEQDVLVHALWDRTAGNPFFASELLRDRDRAELRVGHLGRRVPDGVRDVLRYRLRALPQDTRDAISAAAVLGREAELTRLCHVLDRPEDVVVDALVLALGNGLLVEGGQSWAGGYAFSHDLVREAVYAEIPTSKRQRWHLRAVDALLAGAAADTDVIAAALHVCEAGPAADPVEAADLVDRAARLAAARFGYEEAVRLAEARLPLLDRFATAGEQAGAAVAVARLRIRSGRGYARAVELLEHALAAYLALGETESAGMAHSRIGGVLSVPQPQMDVTRALDHFEAAERLLARPDRVFHLQRGRLSAAMHALDSEALERAADRCAAMADEAGAPAFAAVAGWGRGWRALDLGRPDESLSLLEDAWSSVRHLGDPLLGWPTANAAAMICTVYLLDPSAGRAWCRRGLGQPRFDALEHPHDALADQLALALAESGELDAARRAVDELPAEAVARRHVRFLLGDWEKAAEEWQAALDHDLAAGDLHDAVLNARWLAEARLALGDEPAAEATLHHALDIAVPAPQVPTEVWLRARLAALGSTPPAAAANHLGRCREVLGDGGSWRGLVGEVTLAAASVAARTGDVDGAAVSAQEAVATFAAYRLPWRQVAALRFASVVVARAGDRGRAAALRSQAAAVLRRIGASQRWHEADLNAGSTGSVEG